MIYLDYAATTKCKYPETPFDGFGNSSSAHALGVNAAIAEEVAREQIRNRLNCGSTDQIVFTSGGTEANNDAIVGFVLRYLEDGGKKPFCVAISATAHHSMTETERTIKILGGEVLWLPVYETGHTDPEIIAELGRNYNLILVAVEWVNNELGVVQNIEDISLEAAHVGAGCIVDAVQALPHLHINMNHLGCVSALTLSAHKIDGPKGIGAIVTGHPTMFSPLIVGGKQEYGMRGGTKNTDLIRGFGEAMAALPMRNQTWDRDFELNTHLKDQIMKQELGDIVRVNSPTLSAVPGIINLDIGVDSETVVSLLSDDGIYVSTGAACDGGAANSHVIRAIKKNPAHALRVSFGPDTTKEDLTKFVSKLKDKILFLRDNRDGE